MRSLPCPALPVRRPWLLEPGPHAGQPYSLSGAGPGPVAPFTRAESKAFREAGVREIEIVHQDGSVSMCKLNAEACWIPSPRWRCATT